MIYPVPTPQRPGRQSGPSLFGALSTSAEQQVSLVVAGVDAHTRKSAAADRVMVAAPRVVSVGATFDPGVVPGLVAPDANGMLRRPIARSLARPAASRLYAVVADVAAEEQQILLVVAGAAARTRRGVVRDAPRVGAPSVRAFEQPPAPAAEVPGLVAAGVDQRTRRPIPEQRAAGMRVEPQLYGALEPAVAPAAEEVPQLVVADVPALLRKPQPRPAVPERVGEVLFFSDPAVEEIPTLVVPGTDGRLRKPLTQDAAQRTRARTYGFLDATPVAPEVIPSLVVADTAARVRKPQQRAGVAERVGEVLFFYEPQPEPVPVVVMADTDAFARRPIRQIARLERRPSYYAFLDYAVAPEVIPDLVMSGVANKQRRAVLAHSPRGLAQDSVTFSALVASETPPVTPEVSEWIVRARRRSRR